MRSNRPIGSGGRKLAALPTFFFVRTTILQGVVHLVLFASFLVLAVSP